MSNARILFLDIETSPSLAHVWSLWKQNVGLSQLLETTEVICFVAMWAGEEPMFFSNQGEGGKLRMVKEAHRLLDEADFVIHWNGQSFDVPHLNREFLEAGLTPPSPYKQIDLMLSVKKTFRFMSNKLQHISTKLGLEGKVQHAGHELWIKCMAGDPEAWKKMEEYNRQDVVLLEDLYHQLLPWIPGHPNVNLYSEDIDVIACPACGSDHIQKRGYAYTALSTFQRYRCMGGCGKWFRDNKRLQAAPSQNIAG